MKYIIFLIYIKHLMNTYKKEHNKYCYKDYYQNIDFV